MKEMDPVKIIVEKERYSKYGVHKGMYGWICDSECIAHTWSVNIPQCYDRNDIATINIDEDDMIVVPVMYAEENERILRQWGGDPDNWKTFF